MSAALPPVTLTTDFGTSDHYVAQMKGILLTDAPGVPIVDVTHEIAPQNVRGAAWILADLAPAFPPGTVHVAVVDPGVGSERAILAVAAHGQFYVAPDNGLLSLVLARVPASIVTIDDSGSGGPSVSSTFHGRDVMAPAAARLVRGEPLESLGPPPATVPVRLSDLEPVVSQDSLEGCVVRIDRFGNVITNIRARQLDQIPPERLRVTFGHGRLGELVGLKRCYADVARGNAVALVGSRGFLEIAIRDGDAAQRFDIREGSSITVDAVDR